MIYDFRNGKAAQALKELTQEIIEANSVYTMPALGVLRYSDIEQDGERFSCRRGEDRYLMFAYLARYATKRYNALPKFHTHACVTRDIYSGYTFAQRMPVSIQSTDQEEHFPNASLSMCKYCFKKATHSLWKRGDLPWYQYVLDAAQENRQVMSNGYIDLWRQVSEAVREKAAWTCQQCSIHLKGPAKSLYLETHHRDGNKRNNQEDNLVALCVNCHSDQDSVHRANYSSGPNRMKLDEFARLEPQWRR